MNALPAAQAASLRRLRAVLLAVATAHAAPATEAVAYGVPTICYANGARISFGARSGGLSLYAGHAAARFAERLIGFRIAGTTVHFPEDRDLPAPVVRDLAMAVIADRDDRKAARAAAAAAEKTKKKNAAGVATGAAAAKKKAGVAAGAAAKTKKKAGAAAGAATSTTAARSAPAAGKSTPVRGRRAPSRRHLASSAA